MSKAGGVAGDVLRSLIERIERLDEEVKALNDDKKSVYDEARAQGFEVKIMKEVIRRRRKDQDELDELDALVETYMRALGMRNATRAGAKEAAE